MFASRFKGFVRLFKAGFAGRKIGTGIGRKMGLVAASLMLVPGCISLLEDTPQISNNMSSIQTSQKEQVPESQLHGIINYINDYEDGRKLDLQGKTLVWYECSGIAEIDEQVVNMFRKFVTENMTTISSPYRIIIDRTPKSRDTSPTAYYKKQVQLIILKPDSMKPIHLSKYLSYHSPSPSLSYNTLFSRLILELNSCLEINSSNIVSLTQNLGDSLYEGFIVVNAGQGEFGVRKAKKILGAFLEAKAVVGGSLVQGVVTNQHAASYLGLPKHVEGQDNIFVILPDSQNIKRSGRPVTINSKKYHIFQAWQPKYCTILPPYLQKSHPDSLTLKITVDLNQNIEKDIQNLYKILSITDSPTTTTSTTTTTTANSSKYKNLNQIPKIMIFNSTNTKENPIQISLEKNNFQQLVSCYEVDCRYGDQEKMGLLYGGGKWSWDGENELSRDGLEDWIQKVKNNAIQPTFDSEKTVQATPTNSLRITGQQYLQKLSRQPQKPKIFFHYSQHCFSCKKFKPLFEKLAKQKQNQYNFYRIDNDHNKIKGLTNYNSTPIFVIYRGMNKFLYKNTIFTKDLFQAFLDITSQISIIDGALIQGMVKDRGSQQEMLKEILGK